MKIKRKRWFIGDKIQYVFEQKQTRPHHCHWPGCKKQVPPAMWGCREHWQRLPSELRGKIWAAFRPGQEKTFSPSREYVKVAREVQRWIVANEGTGFQICYGGLLTTTAYPVRGTDHHVFQFLNGTWGARRTGAAFGCCSAATRGEVERLAKKCESSGKDCSIPTHRPKRMKIRKRQPKMKIRRKRQGSNTLFQ